MPAAAMSRSKTALHFVAVDREFALYESDPDRDVPQRMRTKVLLPLQSYEDFGKPEQITVTVVPGSHVGEPDEAPAAVPSPA